MAGKMMYGQFNHSLDLKNRLILPQKLRDQLGGQVVITQGVRHCLFLFSQEEFDLLAEKLASLPMNEKTQRLQHFFFSGATDAEPDKAGRVLIPANLQKFAGIEKELVINGCGKRAEIWAKDRWDTINVFEDDEIQAIMEEVGI